MFGWLRARFRWFSLHLEQTCLKAHKALWFVNGYFPAQSKPNRSSCRKFDAIHVLKKQTEFSFSSRSDCLSFCLHIPILRKVLGFGCWELSHVIFLMLRKKEPLAKLSKFTNWQIFSLKMVLGCRFEENIHHFVNLLSFSSSSFCLVLRKITWPNSQQPKTRGLVEHLAK